MKLIKSAILLSILTIAPCLPSKADVGDAVSLTDSVSITFPQSKWYLDRNLNSNGAVLDSIDSRLTKALGDSILHLRHVSIVGGASPEGSVEFNRMLSENRAKTLFGWFDKYEQLADADKSFKFLGRDWEGVLRLAEMEKDLPYRDETLSLLRKIVSEKLASGGRDPGRSLERLRQLRGGIPYRYLYRNVFPAVRASKVVIDYEKIPLPEVAEKVVIAQVPDTVEPETVPLQLPDTVLVQPADTVKSERTHNPFYMDIRTNMLYDALALPNIGIEFYLGKNFSLGANWMYAWWKTDRLHRYWRAYGGELFGRWWFGAEARRKPLTGHHLGIYGQLYTYDFEWGGEGQMGGKPGGSLWDRNFWSLGLEYGYSLPVSKRLNIDFSLGIGYTQGDYHKYKPIDGHYVWQSTHRAKYFGPTKLEIALVWLLGHGNVNRKGGEK